MRVQKLSFKKLKLLNNNGIVLKNEQLNKYTTFKIGGKVKYFIEIHTLENFIKVMEYLKNINIDIFVLGNGSNLLVSDKGYKGVVIRLKGDFDRIMSKDNRLEMGSGVLLSKAFKYSLDRGLSGFEECGGIPATIGGAVFMNASAYNFEMGKLIEYVVAYDYDKIVYLTHDDCKFSYRHSVFQEKKFIILRVGVKLQFDEKSAILERFKIAITKRKTTQPLECKNAGCIFKKIDNLVVSKMLDEMGIKNLSIGGARVSEKHANFIISENATAVDIKKLIELIKEKFYKRYKINLVEEIIYLGEFDET